MIIYLFILSSAVQMYEFSVGEIARLRRDRTGRRMGRSWYFARACAGTNIASLQASCNLDITASFKPQETSPASPTRTSFVSMHQTGTILETRYLEMFSSFYLKCSQFVRSSISFVFSRTCCSRAWLA